MKSYKNEKQSILTNVQGGSDRQMWTNQTNARLDNPGNEVMNNDLGLNRVRRTRLIHLMATLGAMISCLGLGPSSSAQTVSTTVNISRCQIKSSTADKGGGIYIAGATSKIENTIVVGNTAANGEGGGIRIADSDIDITNVTVVSNSATVGSGGVWQGGDVSDPFNVANSILWLNEIAGSGPLSQTAQILNVSGGVTFSCVQDDAFGGAVIAGTGNIDTDPLFGAMPSPVANGWGDADDDHGSLLPTADSPCVDTGDNLQVLPADLDVIGEPRITRAQVDMGAHEAGLIYMAPGAARNWEQGIDVSTYSSVNLINGNLLTVIPLAGWTGKGPAVEFNLYHNSARSGESNGEWRFSYSRALSQHGDDVILTMDDGREVTFTPQSPSCDCSTTDCDYDAEPGYYLDLQTQSGTCEPIITTKDQTKWHFETIASGGGLTKIVDSAGNAIVKSAAGVGWKVTDATSRWIGVNKDWQTEGDFWAVTDFFNRVWIIKFVDDESGQTGIARIYDPENPHDPANPTYYPNSKYIEIAYVPGTSNRVIESLADPNGARFIYLYDQTLTDRVSRVCGPGVINAQICLNGYNTNGKRQDFQYVPADATNGPKTKYTPRRGPDSGGNPSTVTYTYSEPTAGQGFALQKVERPYTSDTYEHNNRFDVTKRTNSNGQGKVWTWEFDANGNVTKATTPDAKFQQWTYDGLNNVTQYTDAAGHITKFFYNASVDPTALTKVELPALDGQPAGQDVIKLTYYGATGEQGKQCDGTSLSTATSRKGLLGTVTDANDVCTEYVYDANGYVKLETEGFGSNPVYVHRVFDDLGRTLQGWRRGAAGGPTPTSATGGSTYSLLGNMTSSSCVYGVPDPPPTPAGDNPGFLDFSPDGVGLTSSTNSPQDPMQYDAMGRLLSADSTSVYEMRPAPELLKEISESTITAAYDPRGRPLSFARQSNELTWKLDDTVMLGESYTWTYDDWAGVTSRSDGNVRVTTSTDLQGRVTSVVGEKWNGQSNWGPLYSATYTYLANRDLVDTITYGNGATIEHLYDDLDRVEEILHRDPVTQPGPLAILELVYTYDDRGLITGVSESGIDGSATITYDYDERGRLIEEQRTGANAYNFTYAYDAGGNRLTKDDVTNNIHTSYDTYDASNNRLHSYTTVNGANAHVIERVEYEYAEGDAAGNVRRVLRKISDDSIHPQNPEKWNVYATEFFYNRAGEVQVVSQRTWYDDNGTITDEETVAIKEFRGNGRARYLMRDRIADVQDDDYLMPDFEIGTWTNYADDLPTDDRTLTWDTDHYVQSGFEYYNLGLAQVNLDTSPDEIKYFHGDHLGTTRAMTDTPDGPEGPPSTSPAVSPRIVYTAFGEPVSSTGTIDTRYQYVGRHGYETFDGIGLAGPGASTPFIPFMHLGHRWYDPSTGRFLQRDPIGIIGGSNVYAYVSNSPLNSVDPNGLLVIQVGVGGAFIVPNVGPRLPGALSACFQGDVSFYFDTYGNIGIGVTVGAGLGAGAFIGGGLVGGIYSGDAPSLNGPSVETIAGIAVPGGPNISGSVITGPGYVGGQTQIGPGGGYGAGIGGTVNQTVIVTVNPSDALGGFFYRICPTCWQAGLK